MKVRLILSRLAQKFGAKFSNSVSPGRSQNPFWHTKCKISCPEYDTEFQAGRTIVTVKADTARFQQARDILYSNGGYDVSKPLTTNNNQPNTPPAIVNPLEK